MSLQIGKYIYNQLSGMTQSINVLLQPQNAEQLENYIIYKRLSVSPNYTRDGKSFDTDNVQIDIVSSDYISGVDLAQRVRNTLELKQSTYGTIEIEQCTLLSSSEASDGSVFIQSLVFEFITN